MLDQQTFLQGINYLKASYINWNFDLHNDLALKVWYKKFSALDPSTFMQLIELYTDTKSFAPQSPADILNLVPQDLAPADAWEVVLAAIKRAFNNSSFLNIMAKEQPTLYPLVQHWDIENVSEDAFGNKCYTYELGRQFVREYRQHLNNKKLIRLSGSNVTLIEG